MNSASELLASDATGLANQLVEQVVEPLVTPIIAVVVFFVAFAPLPLCGRFGGGIAYQPEPHPPTGRYEPVAGLCGRSVCRCAGFVSGYVCNLGHYRGDKWLHCMAERWGAVQQCGHINFLITGTHFTKYGGRLV